MKPSRSILLYQSASFPLVPSCFPASGPVPPPSSLQTLQCRSLLLIAANPKRASRVLPGWLASHTSHAATENDRPREKKNNNNKKKNLSQVTERATAHAIRSTSFFSSHKIAQQYDGVSSHVFCVRLRSALIIWKAASRLWRHLRGTVGALQCCASESKG